jgi:hypothetical protein
MNILVLLNITPCSPLKVNRRFRGTCRIHLQNRIISQTTNQHEVRTINLEGGRKIFLPKLLLTFRRLHGFVSKRIQFFLTTPVRTLYPSYIKYSSKRLDLRNSNFKYTLKNTFTSYKSVLLHVACVIEVTMYKYRLRNSCYVSCYLFFREIVCILP